MATGPASQDEVTFDYDLSKANYMAKIKKCFDEDSTHNETVIQKTIDILKGPVKTQLHKYYNVSYAFGREILIEATKSPEVPEVQVLTFEDVFDIFIKYHTANNHKGGHHHLLEVEKNLNCSFNYPTVCLSLLVMSCNVCNSKPRKSKSLNKISSVYVTVMVQRQHLPEFRYMLIHIDKATDYVLIRPLRQKSDMEVSMEIFKIMMQFGPPQKLRLHGYNSHFNKRIGVLLRQVCPMFSFSIEHRSANFGPSAYVVGKLQEWMKKNASLAWEIGCSVVQIELNMALNQKIHTEGDMDISSYALFYGKMNTARERNNVAKKSNEIIRSVNDNSEGVIPQSNKLDDDVIELRIPSPVNYDLELFNQSEDSEISQETDFPSVTANESEIKTLESEIDLDSNAIVNDINMSIVRIEDDTEAEQTITSNKEGTTGLGGRKQNLRLLNLNTDDVLVPLDLECDDDNPEDKTDETPVSERKMSLRSRRKVDSTKKNADEIDDEIEEEIDDDIIESTVYKMDEDLVYSTVDVDLEDAIDPLNVDDESLEYS